MVDWSEFAEAEPVLAASIRELLQQYGRGMGYLATVRADGGPRVHPVSPMIFGSGLYCGLINSPKRADLERDGRYALHSYPAEEVDDEAYVAGRAVPISAGPLRDRVVSEYGGSLDVDWVLFEFTVEVAMLARYPRHGGWPPEYQTWRVPAREAMADRL